MTRDDATMQSQERARGKRRSLIWRIATGLLLLIGMTYGCSLMGRQKSLKQAEAARRVSEAGGVVYLDYQWSEGQANPDGRPQQAAWLRGLLGPAWFDRVVAVDLRTAADAPQLAGSLRLFPYIVELNVSDCEWDDAALHSVRSLVGLQSLNLAGTAVTDQGVTELKRMVHLTELSLASTAVSDNALDVLCELGELRRLDLSRTQVTEDGVRRLQRRLPQCQILH